MIPPSRWLKLFGGGQRSIAERSSGRYLIILFLLLALILPIQLYVWMSNSLSKKIDDLVADQKTQYSALAREFNKLDVETKNLQPEKWSQEQQERAAKIIDSARSIQDTTNRINSEASLLQRVSVGSSLAVSAPATPASQQWFDYYQYSTDQMNNAQLQAVQIQEKANLIGGVLVAYILPIVLGSIGAVAYIIRTISEQIRASTFSASSPTRHIMRAALGAMAGVVVGFFSDLSTKLSLPPLAVAFLAGYGVEALFSMFDGFIAKFK
jgi:sensor c-di-GMP phosphodiesterase-like protein